MRKVLKYPTEARQPFQMDFRRVFAVSPSTLKSCNFSEFHKQKNQTHSLVRQQRRMGEEAKAE